MFLVNVNLHGCYIKMVRNVRLDVLWIWCRLFDSIFYRNNVYVWHWATHSIIPWVLHPVFMVFTLLVYFYIRIVSFFVCTVVIRPTLQVMRHGAVWREDFWLMSRVPGKNEDRDNPSKKFLPAGHLHLTKVSQNFSLKWWVFKNVMRPRQVWRVVHLFKSVMRHMAWRVGRISTVILYKIEMKIFSEFVLVLVRTAQNLIRSGGRQ